MNVSDSNNVKLRKMSTSKTVIRKQHKKVLKIFNFIFQNYNNGRQNMYNFRNRKAL